MSPESDTATTATAAPDQPRADARRNREAVIEAAISALATDPNASMADIASAAGLGRTTVYRHFDTREELIVALFERVIEDAQVATAAVIERGEPVPETLQALGPVMISIGERFRFLRAHIDLGVQALAESLGIPDDPVRRFLVAAVDAGELRDDVPISWMQSLMQSTAMATTDEVGAGNLDPETAGRVLGETFVGAFSRR